MSSDILRNPFKRGKGLVLSNLILEGKTNEQIEDYYIGMGFDKKYGALNNNYMYQVRSKLKKDGLLDSEGFPIKTNVSDPSKPTEIKETEKIKDEEGAEKNKGTEEKPNVISPIIRRPDWDLLSIEQINQIGDSELKMNILNYKTEVAKIKQELKPEFATRGEIDQLRVDIGTQIQGMAKQMSEQINKLTPSKADPKAKALKKDDDSEEEAEEESVINPSIVEAENPLSGQEEEEAPKSNAGGSLVEIQKGVIVAKLIGFTTKALMWYELDKAGGLLPSGEPFGGNLADYVCSCIEDVHVVRGIELSVNQRRQVR